MMDKDSLRSLPIDDDALITSEEMQHYVPVAPATLNKWRCEGQGPRFVKLGRLVAYRAGDVRDWLRNRTFAHTSEAIDGLLAA